MKKSESQTTDLAFAVGTPGDFNWDAIYAPTAGEAINKWLIDHPHNDAGVPEAERKPEWDGKRVTSGNEEWFRSGMGSLCKKCGYETWPETGGEHLIDGQVIYEDCRPPNADEENDD